MNVLILTIILFYRYLVITTVIIITFIKIIMIMDGIIIMIILIMNIMVNILLIKSSPSFPSFTTALRAQSNPLNPPTMPSDAHGNPPRQEKQPRVVMGVLE